jgi:hypothetical protein
MGCISVAVNSCRTRKNYALRVLYQRARARAEPIPPARATWVALSRAVCGDSHRSLMHASRVISGAGQVCAFLCVMLAGCANGAPPPPAALAAVGGPAAAGGPGVAVVTPSSPAGAAAPAPVASTSSLGVAGSTAAGSGSGNPAGASGGAAGASAGAGAAGAGGAVSSGGPLAGSGDSAGAPALDDLGLGGLLDPGDAGTPTGMGSTAGMCEQLVCFDIFDCALWHPDEAAVCNFTECTNFVCK